MCTVLLTGSCTCFLQVYKPDSEETFTYQDLYVGASLVIHGRGFKLTEADEYTYTYMENNKHIFVMADADAILKSLQVQVEAMSGAA
jgi:EF-hand domain-containing protein 1